MVVAARGGKERSSRGGGRAVEARAGCEHSREERHHLRDALGRFAVMMNRQDMIALLLELGADPLVVDGSGQPVAIYATEPASDRRVMEKIRAMTTAELTSAARGHRAPRTSPIDLVALLALGDWNA